MKTARLPLKLKSNRELDVQIEEHIREQIRSGRLSDGQRLPSTPVLARRWRVSCSAIQRAMDRLAADSLIERRPKRGTFARTIPETAVVGVLCGPALSDESAHFYRAVMAVMRQKVGERRWICRWYDGLNGLETASSRDNPAYQQFLSDRRSCCFKGLVEFHWGGRGAHWSDHSDLPRVRYDMSAETDLCLDLNTFARQAVEFLARKEARTRLAFLRSSSAPSEGSASLNGFLDAVSELGLPRPDIESVKVVEQGARMEGMVYEKMLAIIRRWQTAAAQGDRPNGLIVEDDVVMRAVALALIRGGVEVPKELEVVSLANEGIHLHYGIPVVRYEFSPKEVVRQLLDLLWKRIRNEPPPPLPIILRGELRGPESQEETNATSEGEAKSERR